MCVVIARACVQKKKRRNEKMRSDDAGARESHSQMDFVPHRQIRSFRYRKFVRSLNVGKYPVLGIQEDEVRMCCMLVPYGS